MPNYVRTNSDRLKSVTLTLDTNAYAQNDVLAATQEITNAVPEGMTAILDWIRLVDKDKNERALELWFLRSNTSIGAENAAEATTDANSDEVLAIVPVLASDYTSEANWSWAEKTLGDDGMGARLKPTTGTSIYIAAKYTDSTGDTYTAAGIELRIGLMVS